MVFQDVVGGVWFGGVGVQDEVKVRVGSFGEMFFFVGWGRSECKGDLGSLQRVLGGERKLQDLEFVFIFFNSIFFVGFCKYEFFV